MVTIDVRHDGLGRFARVSAPSRPLAEQRAAGLSKRWQDRYERRKAALDRAGPALLDTLHRLTAQEESEDAEYAAAALTSILLGALRRAPMSDWSALADTAAFAEIEPVQPEPPRLEAEPQRQDFQREKLTLSLLVNPSAMRRRREQAEAKYEAAHQAWRYLKTWREQEHLKSYRAFKSAEGDWQARHAAFADLQNRSNARLAAVAEGYAAGNPEAVIAHCDMTLLAMDRPEGFPCFWTMAYDQGALSIDYSLPNMDVVPVLKGVKYLPTRQSFETVPLAARERERLYGEAVFQSALAVLHTLFAGDSANAIRSIAFNGWVDFVDQAALRPGRACILSLTTGKEAFSALDLSSIDPQACVRSLNATMGGKLEAMTAREG